MTIVSFQEVDHQLHLDNESFPGVIVNDGSVSTAQECKAWIEANSKTLENALSTSGALLFRGFPISSAAEFDTFSAAFNYQNFTYDQSLSNAVRINHTERVFTANEAPKDVEIFLHHEMAQTPIYPSKLFFFCLSAADEGGATPLCRSDKLFEDLSLEAPALANNFFEKGLKYTTTMPANDDPSSGQGRGWRGTLSVGNKSAAEKKLKELGYTWQWLADDSLLAVTPVLPAVLRLKNEKKVFFNQLVAAYLGWKGVRENPSTAINFGDGTAIPREGLDLIVSLSEKYTFDLRWQDSDIALVDNYMTMHGRRPYSGDRARKVLVTLAAKS